MTARNRSCVLGGCAVAALAAIACNTRSIVVGDLQEVAVLPALLNRDLDLLFVIDDSPSMADQQAALAASFPRMIDKLSQLDGGLPNLHLGVITSDMGTQGSASPVPGPTTGVVGAGGCDGVGDDGALQHVNLPSLAEGFLIDVGSTGGGRQRNYDGELREVFGQLAQVGASGCGFEQHLAALRRSFTNPVNAGFFRPEANLAVVILADEDDCSVLDPALLGPESAALGPLSSFRCFEHGVICEHDDPRDPGEKHGCQPRDASELVEPVAPFAAALLAQKRDPRQVMVAAIVADPAPVRVALRPWPDAAPRPVVSPSCVVPASPEEAADPAIRIADFLGYFPGRSQLTSICGGDLAEPLDAIGATAKRLMGDPCVDPRGLVDTSPEPGVQPACDVTDVRDAAPGEPVLLPPCDENDGRDCHRFVADPAACPSVEGNLRVHVQRVRAAAPDTWTHVRCQRAL